MRILMFVLFAGLISCKAAKEVNKEENAVESYNLSPDHSILRVVVESGGEKNEQFGFRIVKVLKMSSGFPQVSENQLLKVLSDKKLTNGTEFTAVLLYRDSMEGPTFSLVKILTD